MFGGGTVTEAPSSHSTSYRRCSADRTAEHWRWHTRCVRCGTPRRTTPRPAADGLWSCACPTRRHSSTACPRRPSTGGAPPPPPSLQLPPLDGVKCKRWATHAPRHTCTAGCTCCTCGFNSRTGAPTDTCMNPHSHPYPSGN
jgi:hypothetical protein